MATQPGNLWRAADNLAGLLGEKPIARPAMLDRKPARMTRFWPDCAICGCALEQCDCNPDAYAAALLKMWGVS